MLIHKYYARLHNQEMHKLNGLSAPSLFCTQNKHFLWERMVWLWFMAVLLWHSCFDGSITAKTADKFTPQGYSMTFPKHSSVTLHCDSFWCLKTRPICFSIVYQHSDVGWLSDEREMSHPIPVKCCLCLTSVSRTWRQNSLRIFRVLKTFKPRFLKACVWWP